MSLNRHPGFRERMYKLLGQILEALSQKEAQSRLEAVAPEIEGIRRREKVIRIFPNRESAYRP